MSEIFIICNSPQSLQIISNGAFADLHKRDLFTCNNAYTYFRTEGRHLNFFTDTEDIMRKVVMPETLSDKYQNKIEFVYSPFGMRLANGNLIYPTLNYSPIENGCSTGLGALAYLNAVEEYDIIWMLGYTLNEWGNSLWHSIEEGYNIVEFKPKLFKLKRKNQNHDTTI